MSHFVSGNVDELAALVAIASQGSFVAAGQAIERHPTLVSRRISALEKRLGVRLVERTTRRVKLTEAGFRLVDKITEAACLIDEAEEEARAGARELRGRLRLALPGAMGRMWLAPLLPGFLASHPSLSIEVDFSDSYIDLISGGYDAAVRIGLLDDSGLVVRKLADYRRILCASPEYLARHGTPAEPRDLAKHNCLELPLLSSFPEWRLGGGSRRETVTVSGSYRSSDSVALLEAARAGIGILGAGEWLTARDRVAGTLVRVLPDWSFDADGGIHLVRPSARFLSARTKAYVDWVVQLFRGGTPWQDLS